MVLQPPLARSDAQQAQHPTRLPEVGPWQIFGAMLPNRWIDTTSNSQDLRAILGRQWLSGRKGIWRSPLSPVVAPSLVPTAIRSHLPWALKGGLARLDLDNNPAIRTYVRLHRTAIGCDGEPRRRNANGLMSTHARWIRPLSLLKWIIQLKRVVATRALGCPSCKVEETACRNLGLAS